MTEQQRRIYQPMIVFIALLLTILVMRGPITCVGAVADEVIRALDIGYPAYGFLSALPIACFGLFCAVAPTMSKRFGLLTTVLICLVLILLGTAGRLIFSYTVMLTATALIGIGIAVLNVLMPVLLRDYFPNNIPLVMGVFTGFIGFSGSIGAYFSVPLFNAFDSLSAPLGLWVIMATLGLIAWFLAPRGKKISVAGGAFQWSLLRKPLTWAVIFVMGMQSLTIYTTVAWLPTILSTQGFSASTAGLGSAVFLLVSAPASIMTAAFIKAVRSERTAAAMMTVSFALGIVLWLMGGAWSFVGCVLAGIPQGITFSMAMILMAQKTNNLSELLVISSLSQGIGYILAGFGPFICGLLYQGDGRWGSVVAFMLAAVFLWGAAALYAFGNRKLF